MWVLGFELRLSVLAASTVIHWAILLVHKPVFIIIFKLRGSYYMLEGRMLTVLFSAYFCDAGGGTQSHAPALTDVSAASLGHSCSLLTRVHKGKGDCLCQVFGAGHIFLLPGS